MRSKGYSTWFVSLCVCVCLSVCLLPHFLPLRAMREENNDTRRFVAATASFKNGDFHKTAAFKSYGLKTKRTS